MATREDIDALPDSWTLRLRKPIEHGKETITELTFEEPLAGHIDQVSKMDNVKATIQLLAFSAGVDAKVIAGLSAREFKQASDFIESFMQDAQPTGEAA